MYIHYIHTYVYTGRPPPNLGHGRERRHEACAIDARMRKRRQPKARGHVELILGATVDHFDIDLLWQRLEAQGAEGLSKSSK